MSLYASMVRAHRLALRRMLAQWQRSPIDIQRLPDLRRELASNLRYVRRHYRAVCRGGYCSEVLPMP